MTSEEARKLTYDFLDLSWVFRLDVARQLGLTDDSDIYLSDNDRMTTYFVRAKEKDLLSQMRMAINKAMEEAK